MPRTSSSSKPSARPSGAAAAACPPSTRPTCWPSPAGGRRPLRASTRPRSARSSAAASARSACRAFNVARTAWLTAGLPLEVAATTVDTQCGSSQQATNLATSLVGAGVVDVAVACGVEVMSRVPIGSNSQQEARPRRGRSPRATSASTSSPRSSRAPSASPTSGASPATTPTRFGLRSQQRAAQAWAEDRFATQIVARRRPRPRRRRQAHRHAPTTSPATRACATPPSRSSPSLKPVAREDGVHTAGISSQISDGAAAVLLMTAREGRGARPHARGPASSTPASSASTRCSCSPAPSTPPSRLLARTGLTHRRHRRHRDQRGLRLGGAGLGRASSTPTSTRSTPTAAPSPSATRSAAPAPFLITKALHELERTDGTLRPGHHVLRRRPGTGTIIERV